ncbi:endonuclease NucS [Telmatobacter sp. DSM 110680]|uniref:Endonuclease NucS n=1 Tax=Telmatobacter sp. DSM 110680 TaxID=3036704 RepID=A0AAU7DRF4_9BACT
MFDARRDSHEIAEKTGLSLGTVAALRAHHTMRKTPLGSEEAEVVEEALTALTTTFGLERDLQKVLRDNIDQLEPGLKIADDNKEKRVRSGYIDITAQDKNGATVVIELKAVEADRDAVGQLLAYMGDLMSDGGRSVRGILVAPSFSPRATSAAHAARVELKRYSVKFLFESANRSGAH